MTTIATSDLGAEFTRIFGAQRDSDGPGRTRLCKVCGGWHPAGAVPHNCRAPAPPRNRALATPQLAPKFEEFRTGALDGAETIGDPRAKREFMARHDLVEWDDGVKPEAEPTERQWMEGFVQDFKRAQQEDPLNRPPVDVIGQTDLDGAGEVDVAQIEVSK